MSSPAVADVALMLEANPALSSDQVRTILEETAREDNNTGTLPEEGDPVLRSAVTATAAIQAALGIRPQGPLDSRPTPTLLKEKPPCPASPAHLAGGLRGFDGRLVRRFAGRATSPWT